MTTIYKDIRAEEKAFNKADLDMHHKAISSIEWYMWHRPDTSDKEKLNLIDTELRQLSAEYRQLCDDYKELKVALVQENDEEEDYAD